MTAPEYAQREHHPRGLDHAHAHQLAAHSAGKGEDGRDGDINGTDQQDAQHPRGHDHVDGTALEDVHVIGAQIPRNADADQYEQQHQHRQQRDLPMLDQQRVQGSALSLLLHIVPPYHALLLGMAALRITSCVRPAGSNSAVILPSLIT